jgi:hypothetical protein
MADAADSKSVARKGVWVQVPPPALQKRRERVGFTIVRPHVPDPQEGQLLGKLLGKSPKIRVHRARSGSGNWLEVA